MWFPQPSGHTTKKLPTSNEIKSIPSPARVAFVILVSFPQVREPCTSQLTSPSSSTPSPERLALTESSKHTAASLLGGHSQTPIHKVVLRASGRISRHSQALMIRRIGVLYERVTAEAASLHMPNLPLPIHQPLLLLGPLFSMDGKVPSAEGRSHT